MSEQTSNPGDGPVTPSGRGPDSGPGSGLDGGLREPTAEQGWEEFDGSDDSGDFEDLEHDAEAWAQADHEDDPDQEVSAHARRPYLRRVWATSEVESLEEQLDAQDALVVLFPAAAADRDGPPDAVDHDDAPAAAARPAEHDAAQDGNYDDQHDGEHQHNGEHDGGDDGVAQVKYTPEYASVYDWYENWFRYAYTRRIDGRRRVWSATWYTSREALERMDALWRAWEAMRRDPELGSSSWFLRSADPHMAVLMSPDGPLGHKQGEESSYTESHQPLAWIRPGPSPEVDPAQDTDAGPPRATMSILARYRARRARNTTGS